MDMLKDERFDFTILENDIVRDTEKYSKNELLAYIAICFYADKKRQCFPSYETIAKTMRTSRTTAINAVQGLVEKGVIKLENRKADEKKKEMTSNLYTLVSNDAWEKVLVENRKYLLNKAIDYKKRYKKGQVTKATKELELKKQENDKKNTPVSSGFETDVNKSSEKNFINSYDELIVPQENSGCKEETFDKNRQDDQQMSERFKERFKLLKDAGIKYVPYKSDPGVIESMDIGILKQAIEITVEQSISKSWKYLLSTFDSISHRNSLKQKEEKENIRKQFKPKYSGGIGVAKGNYGGKYFEDWNPDEFNDMVAMANRLY